jgi:hypothetical protein
MKRKEKIDCPTGLTHCGSIHYPSHQFHRLTWVNIVYRHLFISPLGFLRFNHLIVCCLIFKPGLNRS